MDAVVFQNITFKYENHQEDENTNAQQLNKLILDDITTTIHKGEFVAIVGQNGSGKSTLSKHINALLLPTDGTVLTLEYDTRDEDNTLVIREHAGMVFQNPDNQIVTSVVEDDVAFGPENLGVEPAEIRIRVDEALASVNMSDFKQRAPHTLSGGQKQRIAIAGVLAMRPDILILDEPTAMLDPQGRREVINIAKDLHAQGMTIILITHFMDEAMLAERMIVLNEGKIALSATPEEIFKESEKIIELGLELPFPIRFAQNLQKHGMPIADVTTEKDLVDAICQYALKM